MRKKEVLLSLILKLSKIILLLGNSIKRIFYTIVFCLIILPYILIKNIISIIYEAVYWITYFFIKVLKRLTAKLLVFLESVIGLFLETSILTTNFIKKNRAYFLAPICAWVLFTSLEYFKTLPNPKTFNDFPQPQKTMVYDRYGTLLFEKNIIIPVNLEKLPQLLVESTLIKENNLPSLRLAALFTSENKSSIKNILTVWLVSNRINANFSKKQLLSLYYNILPFGDSGYGIESASMSFFNSNINGLSNKELIFLCLSAGSRNIRTNDEDINDLINQLRKKNIISAAEAKKIAAQKISFTKSLTYKRAPDAVDYTLNLVNKEGVAIETTVDLNLENNLRQLIIQNAANLRDRVDDIGMMVINSADNNILALIGSANYYSQGENIIFGKNTNIYRKNVRTSLKENKLVIIEENTILPENLKIIRQVKNRAGQTIYNDNVSLQPEELLISIFIQGGRFQTKESAESKIFFDDIAKRIESFYQLKSFSKNKGGENI